MDKAYYQLSAEEVLKRLNTSLSGLTKNEAVERLSVYGKNKLPAKKRKSLIIKFISQLKDLFSIILLSAGMISFFLHEYRDMTVMLSIVFLNAMVGFVQEFKAEKVMDALTKMVNTKAKVIRNGKLEEISAENVVPGDIVSLEEGDAIPADVRVLISNNLSANDFSLTGESNPVKKFIYEIKDEMLLGDRNNLVFMGTTVATGNGKGVVCATGIKTEIGRIANLSQETQEDLSPLQKEMNYAARQVAMVALVIGLMLFSGAMVRHSATRDAFLFALAVAASCVPEGTPTQIAIALSLAASRLAKKNSVVKKLSAVETLGATHIICTDKTGTLTKNEMTVKKYLIGKNQFLVDGVGYEPKGVLLTDKGHKLSKEEIEKDRLFFELGVLASNARVYPPDEDHKTWYAIGDPTEAAILTFSEKAGFPQKDLDKKYDELKEFPFDASRKMMSSVRKIENGKVRLYLKGAPIVVLDKCKRYYDGEKIREIQEGDKGFVIKAYGDYAKQALRVLAYAYRDLENYNDDLSMEEAEDDLIFLGLVAMMDPPREEVKAAIEAAKKAKIRVLIITGDHALTAEAIAKQIGIGDKEGDKIKAITGDDLKEMSDIELLHNLINENIIFSRTSPEDKMRVVDLLKRAGELVAVTGDGVNDAPALKRADIGVAMGQTGTEVAKDASEIILLDDSFSTLITAIKEGRIIFRNITKTVLSSLTSNGGELFAVLFGMLGSLFGLPMAILAIQILAVDLIGEMAPLTALTWDPGEDDVMDKPPRNPVDHILNKKSLINVVWCGALMGGLAYLNFLFLAYREGFSWTEVGIDTAPVYFRAMTLTYVTIVFVQWANILSRRTKGFVFSKYLWSNPKLFYSFLISLFFILNIVYNPYIQPFFHTGSLMVVDWMMAVLMAGIYLGIREGWKKLGARF